MSFPTYELYSDSGHDVLGDVPSHWDVTRLGFLCDKIGSGKTPKGGSETYVNAGVLFVRSQNVYDDGLRLDDVVYITDQVDEEMSTSRVEAGDILLNITGASLGRTCLVPDDFEPANVNQHVCIIRMNDHQQREYVAMVMKAFLIKSQIDSCQNGAAREGLNFEQIRKVWLALPPRDEQEAIATFLNAETSKIDALVAEQRRLVDLLKEKRQAVISHAVTKGLNPDAPMKPSGIQWLGDVPEHWEVAPLMRLTPNDRQIMYGIILPGPNVENGIPIVKGGDVKPHRLTPVTLSRTTIEIESKYVRSRLRGGDIVYSIRGSIGDAELVPDELTDANITQDVARISPLSNIHGNWLLMAMRSSGVFSQLDQTASGATIRGINIFRLKRARIPVPPHKEQVAIAEMLEEKMETFSQLETAAERAIQLLQERRTALISAAVTGKIDVRNHGSTTA